MKQADIEGGVSVKFLQEILEEFWCYLLHWQIFYQEKMKNKMHQNEKGALSFVFINFYGRDFVRWGIPKAAIRFFQFHWSEFLKQTTSANVSFK